MAYLERHVQTGVKEKEYREWEKKWEAVEKRLGGFQPKRHYQPLFGAESSGTMVWERDWDNLAAFEAAYTKFDDDPQAVGLFAEHPSIVTGGERTELYWVW